MDHISQQQRPDRQGISDRHRGIVFTAIPVGHIAPLWLDVEPMLRPALYPGETPVEVLSDLFNGDAQLWIAFEDGKPLVAVVTQILTENGRKLCNIWAVGGSGLDRCFNNLSTIEAWAKSEGCAAVTVDHGRPGWQRLMDGYKITHVSLEKEL